MPFDLSAPNTQSEMIAIAAKAKRHADDLNRWHVAAGCRTRLVGTGDVLAAAFAEIDAKVVRSRAVLAAQASQVAA
jgi:hypothetical protein